MLVKENPFALTDLRLVYHRCLNSPNPILPTSETREMEFLSPIIRLFLLGKNLKIKILLINCCGLNPLHSLNDIFQVLNSNPSLTSSSTIIPAPLPIVNNRNSSRNFRAATAYSPSQHGDDPWLRFM